MIKVENIETWGFDHAIRGMRNPMNSWDKSDSDYGCGNLQCWKCQALGDVECDDIYHNYVIGVNDLTLMRKLYKGGSEHRKYLRQIFVSMDITAPLYWWKEFDTYKVGTVANSCSTMHKIHAKEFTLDDFSHEHLIKYYNQGENYYFQDYSNASPLWLLTATVQLLNRCRCLYLKTNDKKWWWQLIQLLPSSYNQCRTITMNYENVVNMIQQREHHKLDEWREFVDILRSLPYVQKIMEE